MLLSSAQVSVAISSTIVSIFTITLFLSGYILQQRTVSNLREAIKPKARPVHTFVHDVVSAVPGVQTVATPLPVLGDGAIVIEVPGAANVDQEIPREQQQTITKSVQSLEETISSKEDVETTQEEVPLTEEEIVADEDRLMVSSRIRRPNQVDNAKKDKEWAEQLQKAKKGKSGLEDIPLEQLSRAERRKVLKHQLSIQEGQQPADPRAYRPRRRLW